MLFYRRNKIIKIWKCHKRGEKSL